MSRPLGVILAGGQATRMGGGDKGLLPLGDGTILSHVIDRLAPQVAGLALNANGDPARFDGLNLPVLPDSIADFPGPLAGVLAGLDWAAAQGAETIVTVAADTPFFPCDLVERLLEVAQGMTHPLVLAATPRPENERTKSLSRSGLIRHPHLRPLAGGPAGRSARRAERRAAQGGAVDRQTRWPRGPVRRSRRSFLQRQHPRRPATGAGHAKGQRMNVYGVVGWKNAGKTGLMERLVTEITGRGISVSTVKHAHHSFDVDHPGKDSHRHRIAGATEVLLASRNRFALMHELRDEAEPALSALLQKLAPVDLVLIEGYKRDSHPKIEAHRAVTGNPLIAPDDATVRAVASDTALDLDRPVFDLNDTAAIADFILSEVGL